MKARNACRFVIVAILLATFGCKENVPAPEPVAAPGFFPEGGAYDGALEVTLRTDTEGAGIRYTVDGSTPSAIYGRPYDGFPFTVSSSVTIRAVAWMAGRSDSPVTTVTYTLAGTTETPVFSPDAGAGPFDPGQLVSVSTGTPGAEIWYTMDGSDPRPLDGYGTPYLGVPVAIDSTTILKAAAMKPGASPSMTVEARYVISEPAAIDWEGDVGKYCAMAQATGALLIAYRDDTSARLKLARFTDGGITWSTRFLDWQGDVGQYVSIGASGSVVAVAYRAAGAPDLRCAVSTDAGLTWHRYPVTGAGADCRYTSTAIGPTGTIHIAYYEIGGADLKLAWSDDAGATWGFNTIDSSISTAGWQCVSIAVNGTKVYAAYYFSASADLRFAWAPTPNGGFAPNPIESAGSVGQYCSLRYNAQSDTLWVAYHDAINGGLKAARWKLSEANWVLLGIIDDEGVTGLHASLAVSGASGQNLAIAYYEDWEYRLKVARSTDAGVTWTKEIVDEDGVGQWASIVATGPDTYTVSYYDSLAGDLRLAQWDGTDWAVR
jgi:hypothetical protein